MQIRVHLIVPGSARLRSKQRLAPCRVLAWGGGESACGRGGGVLRLLLGPVLTHKGGGSLARAALGALGALVAAAPPGGGRAALFPVLTSGAH